jgi:DHA3 family macrolide efflux protein-like MFS transporter
VARSYGEEVWRLTANEVTFFLGSIIGGVIMTAWGGFKNRFRTIGFSCVLWAILFTGLGLTNNFYVYLVFMFLAGIPMPMWNASTMTLLQEITRPDMQGRIFGVMGLIMNTVMPLGMLIFGPLSDRFSIEALLILTSVLMAVPGVWIFFNREPLTPGTAGASRDFEMQPGD